MRSRLFLVCVAFGCTKTEAPTPAAPPAAQAVDYASAISHEVRFDGARGGIVVAVRVAPGFHVYSTGEETGRPLKLEVEAPTKLGEVVYPEGVEKHLSIGRSVTVEGACEVFGKVEDGGGPEVKGTFHYQVCTDAGCDRPRRKKFSVNRP